MLKEEKIYQIRFFSAFPVLVFGLLMVVVPSFTAYTVCTVVGALLSLVGLVELVLFLTEAKIRHRLLLGVLCTALGTVLISLHTTVAILIAQLLLGTFLIVDGTYKTRLSFELRARRARIWGVPLAVSLVMIVSGVCVVFWPEEGAFLPTLFGIAAMVNSVGELLIGFYNGNYSGRAKPMMGKKKKENKKSNPR